VELEAHLLEREPRPARLEGEPGGRLERDHLRDPAGGIDRVDAEVGVRMVAPAAKEDLPVRGPAERLIRQRVESQPARLASLGAHHVDVVVALVLRGEGDELAVGGDARELLVPLVGGHPLGGAPRDGDPPDVPLRGEDDGPASDRRKPIEAVGGRVGGEAGGGKQRGQGDPDRDQGSLHRVFSSPNLRTDPPEVAFGGARE
jgi:hypothetical protein